MAVKVITKSVASPDASPDYIGLSSDTKPTMASHVGMPAPAVGSTYYEYDTFKTYITYDGTNWVQKKSSNCDLVSYAPGIQTTNDLEAATKTITATAKGAVADYSAALTLAAPTDARLAVQRICSRLQVTRDSGTSANLYCSVFVDSADGSDANKRLFNAVDIQAGNLASVDVHASNLATIFNLLKDGAAHTFYFFFWVNSGDSVISLVQLWEGVGTNSLTYLICLALTYSGLIQAGISFTKIGSGTPQCVRQFTASPLSSSMSTGVDNTYGLTIDPVFALLGTVATDLNYVSQLSMVLRSE